MATWKKVIVSGSNISQLNNDAGYLTTIPTLEDLTLGNGLVSSSLYNGSVARTAAVGAGTHITVNTNDVAVNTTTLIPAITGSIFSGISGDVLIDSSGVATIQPDSVALGTDTTGDYVANLGTGTGVTIGSNTGEGSQPTISVDYGSTSNTAVQGNTTITINGTTNEVEITGTSAQALGGAPSYTIGLPNDVTISNNLLVSNDLTVLGTASFQNTTNLEVADRFVLFASGSNTTGDGGIVVQQATQDIGEAFGWDSATERWGVETTFNASTSNLAPDAFMAAVTTLASTDPNSSGPASRYEAVGNIYVSSNDESIWIYS